MELDDEKRKQLSYLIDSFNISNSNLDTSTKDDTIVLFLYLLFYYL